MAFLVSAYPQKLKHAIVEEKMEFTFVTNLHCLSIIWRRKEDEINGNVTHVLRTH